MNRDIIPTGVTAAPGKVKSWLLLISLDIFPGLKAWQYYKALL